MTPLQKIKEEYERKAEGIDILLKKDLTITGRKLVRFVVYKSLYREFANELGRLMQEETNRA
jgi:hypothetical protein